VLIVNQVKNKKEKSPLAVTLGWHLDNCSGGCSGEGILGRRTFHKGNVHGEYSYGNVQKGVCTLVGRKFSGAGGYFSRRNVQGNVWGICLEVISRSRELPTVSVSGSLCRIISLYM